jgi:hypothetical protein
MLSFPSIGNYNSFITLFINKQVFAGRYGTGTMPKKFNNLSCNSCKSHDHHTSNCPYPLLLGWQAPQDKDFPWINTENLKKRGTCGKKLGNYNRGCTSQGYNHNRRNN